MYFESRVHVLRPVADANEAARLIKNQQSSWYEALQWSNGTYDFLCVADGHIDNLFLEVAVLRKEPDGKLVQVESITAGWIDTWEEFAASLIMAQDAPPWRREIQLILEEPKGHEMAWFTCGCCGEGFSGNVDLQLKFGQDAGYGICDKCRIRYI